MHILRVAIVAAISAIPVLHIASAADLPVKAPQTVLAPVYNWTGFYVGGNVGYGWGTAENNLSLSHPLVAPGLSGTLAATDSNKIKGVIGGLQAGYNWQFARNWLAGVEADIQASGQKGSNIYGATIVLAGVSLGNNAATVTDSNKLDWFGTVRGRLGVTSDRWLVYATGGLAYGSVNVNGNVQPANYPFNATANAPIVWDQSTTKVGWTIGAGVENALSGNWSWKIEYLYMNLGSVTANYSGGVGTNPGGPGNCYASPASPGCSPVLPVSPSGAVVSKLTDNIVRVGINYKFN
jgi:outer membrane immunogenic protein